MALRIATNAADPSVDGGLVAWHEAGKAGILLRDGQPSRVGGAHPALGGGRIAVVNDGQITITTTAGGAPVAVTAPAADAVALSAEWLVWRARDAAGDALFAQPLAGGAPREVARAAELGRPAVQGGRLAYHVHSGGKSRIVLVDLASGQAATVRSERRSLLLNPSLQGRRLLYVRATYMRQDVRIGPQTRQSWRRDRRLWSTVPTGRRDAGHEPGDRHERHGHPHKLWKRPRPGVSATLWTTALTEDHAYVTRLRQITGRPLVAEILRIDR